MTHYEYGPLNQLTRMTDSLGGVTSFTYDGNGNLLTVTDARGKVTTYTVDNMDRLKTRKDPLLKTETYDYDLAGNVTKFTDRRGKVTALQYDPLNRLKFAGFDAVTHRQNTTYESTITYGYDGGNRMRTVVDSLAGTITLTPDDLDRPQSEATPQGTVSYTFDAADRLSTLTVAGQPAVTYEYDEANRLVEVSQATSVVAVEHDDGNRRSAVTLPNGIRMEYGYDASSQLTTIDYTMGVNVLGGLSYEYDDAGLRTLVAGSYARTGLPSAVTSTQYNDANQLKGWGSANLNYDLNGNLTGDGTYSYTWDGRNQLSLIKQGQTTIGSFAYDGFGRRVSKTVSGTSTGFLYDGANIVQELSGATPTANLLTGLGIDEVFSRTDAAGSRSFLTAAPGSTLALTDSGGALQTQYTYEPFGKTTTSGPASTNAFQFTGRENDATGLYFLRARYYNPQIGRFISEDPAGFAGGDNNFYAYVFSNPTNLLDPTGLDAWTSFGGGVRAIGGVMEATAGFGLGAATSWTGIGAVAGGVVGLHGLDQAQAGLRQLLSGCHVDSSTSQGLQGLGLSQSAANLTDAAISGLGSLGTGAATQAMRAGGLNNIFYYEAGQSTRSLTEFAEFGDIADPVARGMKIVESKGWARALLSGFLSPSQFANTIPQGPTPLGSAGLGISGAAANALGGRDCGCEN